MAEGTGGRVHAVDLGGGMAFEFAGKFAESHDARDGEDAGYGESGVEDGSGVALGEDEAVAVIGVGVLGIEFHGVEKYPGDQLGGGHAGGGMSGAGGGGGHHGINAEELGFFFYGGDTGGGRRCGCAGAHECSFTWIVDS